MSVIAAARSSTHLHRPGLGSAAIAPRDPSGMGLWVMPGALGLAAASAAAPPHRDSASAVAGARGPEGAGGESDSSGSDSSRSSSGVSD